MEVSLFYCDLLHTTVTTRKSFPVDTFKYNFKAQMYCYVIFFLSFQQIRSKGRESQERRVVNKINNTSVVGLSVTVAELARSARGLLITHIITHIYSRPDGTPPVRMYILVLGPELSELVAGYEN